MNTRYLHLIARSLMALIFLVAGARKALAYAGTVAYFSKLGLPAPELLSVLVIALELGGGLALVLGWQPLVVALGMGVYTLVTAYIGHPFWAVEPAQYAGQLNNFLKNVAMAGGFLLLALQARATLDE